MANFIVTFRIADDSTYRSRYDSFTKTLIDFAGNSGSVWDETTSFYVFKKDSDANAVVSHLDLKSDFDATKDLMVVIDVSRRVKATKGRFKYLSLLTTYLGF